MDEQRQRRRAREQSRRRHRPGALAPLVARPDRVALWAVFMALIGMLAAWASSAQGQNGGLGPASTEAQGGQCADANLGERALRLGDCGPDVRTLNWILNSTSFGRSAPMNRRFVDGTDGAVRRLQRRRDLPTSGVVDARTRRQLVRSMRRDLATWYGPGFYGNRTACGQVLRRNTVGVAHRTLPCGTRVTIRYKKRFLNTRVIDRGPYAHGARWDLTNGASKRLNFTHTDRIRVSAIRRSNR